MKVFAAVILLSIIVHIGILLIPLPEFKIKKNEVVPITIVDIKKEKVQKKSTPKRKKVVKKQEKKQKKPSEKKEVVKKENVKKPVEQKTASLDKNVKKYDKKDKSNNTQKKTQNKPKEQPKERKPYRPKGADEPLVLPDINVPLTTNMDMPEVTLPDIPKPDVSNNVAENQRNIDVSKELASLKSSEGGASSSSRAENSNQALKEAASSGRDASLKSNLYNFDIAPSGNRKIIYVPEDPVFALANDTYVTIKFNIDKHGNTYNISFVKRSSLDVEKLAYDYINKMKFDAIIEDRDDFAQITMFFKVRN